MRQDREVYQGFEQGPIRPPSESGSLLIRVTRNCPWNRCTFCGLYKGEVFSRRPVAHVCRDIDTVARCVAELQRQGDEGGGAGGGASLRDSEPMAWYAARNWLLAGGRSVFLQDSNSLIIKPDELVAILAHLRATFPGIERITSYARSQTVARISDADLGRIAAAGLNRIHIGMESGADEVLAQVRKGADRQAHIDAGRKVVAAGIELSEYYMPGLGGRRLSREHALGSAEVLNQINPHFIRLRTLAIPSTIDLAGEVASGAFEQLGDRETAEELLLFLENLSGITSRVKSDHILNLFEEVDGVLPTDRERMLAVVREFLDMAPEEQVLYQIGRRTGLFRRLADRHDPSLRRQAREYVDHWQVTPANVDRIVGQLMQRFI
ncbi:radical SAM protein [Desulfobulbus alkaliphilus]|uniref:radical SAM protein n=1 Tax=Desulfobulbus alkaliphilus TaxID=869814 RepID=UPI00196536CA|nr:radical SAM protein [Desulfobulbus alkaliphilus]MBM9537077.1 radical SAM protein [Desulfobulbus alkaliphilus]